jgi:xylan 1,4-beta-xylosidase
VFEEQGIVKEPFYGGFGLLAEDDLPKPSFNAFKLLHRLGDRRLDEASDSALVTRRADGRLVIAIWNESLPDHAGEPKTIVLHVKGFNGRHQAAIYRVDSTHGSLMSAYASMGKPINPTQKQIAQLRRAAEMPPPENQAFHHGEIRLILPPKGLALIELK